MPLPFILAGAALIAGAYGAKKGVDAYQDSDDAEQTLRKARRLYDRAQEDLDEKRKSANQRLEEYGELKFNVYEQSLTPFVTLFSHFKDVELNKLSSDAVALSEFVSEKQLTSMKNSTIAFQEVMAGGVSAIGAGGLAGLAAYGGAGMLATASTGTAISTLSGVAATNATLAWFGGGALSAGGLGVAGGTAVLGGIVAGPVLAIGGSMWASKAKEAKENAYAKLSEAELAAEEMENAAIKAKAVGDHFTLAREVLSKLNQTLQQEMGSLVSVLETERSRQHTWRLDKVDEIKNALSAVAQVDSDYQASNKGFFNRLKNIFSSNPCLPKLIEAYDQLAKITSAEPVRQNISNLIPLAKAQDAKSIQKSVAEFTNEFALASKKTVAASDEVSWTLMIPNGESQQTVFRAAAVASSVSAIVQVDMMSDSGMATEESKHLLEELSNKLNEDEHTALA